MKSAIVYTFLVILMAFKRLGEMSEKQKKSVSMIPRIFIFMAIVIYCSGIVKSQFDLIWFIIGSFFLSIMLFFVDISKLLRK